jgi:opacity protein-like surface antigen
MHPRTLLVLSLVLLAAGLVALLASSALAAQPLATGDGGGGGDALGYLGGASGIGGMTLVAYILVRYLPKRDKDLMESFEKKDALMFATLEKKDVMWSGLLKENDASWQAKFDEVTASNKAMEKTQEKLRTALLSALGKPGMTALSIPAVSDET